MKSPLRLSSASNSSWLMDQPTNQLLTNFSLLLHEYVTGYIETNVINVVPPGHPYRFPFLFPFFSFLRFFPLSFLSFSVSHSSFLFRSFFSFRLFVFRLILVSPSSLLFSRPCLSWWRIMFFCYFVSALHPACAPCEPEVCVLPLRAVFFLSCVAD